MGKTLFMDTTISHLVILIFNATSSSVISINTHWPLFPSFLGGGGGVGGGVQVTVTTQQKCVFFNWSEVFQMLQAAEKFKILHGLGMIFTILAF